jgi:hypothetical protein
LTGGGISLCDNGVWHGNVDEVAVEVSTTLSLVIAAWTTVVLAEIETVAIVPVGVDDVLVDVVLVLLVNVVLIWLVDVVLVSIDNAERVWFSCKWNVSRIRHMLHPPYHIWRGAITNPMSEIGIVA